ncbi:MAG: DUF421 domain-containing protein [Oscillospiraceae bacterium]
MLNVTIRTIIVYALIVIVFRIMGKRQLGELAPNELVTTILISNLASLPIEETDLPLLTSVVPILMIVAFEVFMTSAELSSSGFSRLVSGSPKAVVSDGTINQKMLRNLRFGIDDLLEALRNKDVYDINDVSYAVVETNGTLNVCLNQMPPLAVVTDGECKSENLKLCGHDEDWLKARLREGHTDIADVALAQCSCNGTLTVIKREKK